MKKTTETEMVIHMLDYHKVPEETDDGIPYSLWGRVCAYRGMGIEEIRLQMKSEEKKVEDKNDWHKRGELPPVGTVCRRRFAASDDVVVTITYVGDGVLCYRDENGIECSVESSYVEFHPLQTERERLIHTVLHVINEKSAGRVSAPIKFIVESLADAGMLKMPEDK